ncbi:methyl-accepting chemotaxis protein [Defluviitalea saccharophila]|uniref:Methyl-accepting chemotaxis protein n=1 Tax=Defluviitalea saccharophila TaxID=879970 RepID=A0ABZ2Y5E7_9FIRM
MSRIDTKEYRFGIREKLYISFFLIIILLSSINIVIVFNSSGYIRKYDSILNNIMSANAINGILKEELDAQMNEIVVGKSTFEEGKQNEILEEVKSQLNVLAHNVQTEEIKSQVEIITRTFNTLTNQINKIGEQIAQNKTYEEKMAALEYMTEITSIIDDEIQKLVYLELIHGEQVRANIHNQFIGSIIFNSITLGVLILISLFGTWYISKSISNPIQQLHKNASHVASGNLTVQHVHVKSRDEVHLLAQSFDQMVNHLRHIISSVYRTSNKVSDSSIQLYESIQSSQQATEEVAAATQKIMEIIYNQNKELKTSVEEVDKMSSIFSGLLEESEGILRSANQSVEVAAEGNKYIEDFMNQLNYVSESIDQTAIDIEAFNTNISEMNAFIKTIKDIAAQTNLLALNASIEAAKAGEMGRGFSVVAQEVKKLAYESEMSAKEIEEKINKAQNKIQGINDRIKEGVSEIIKGNEKANKAKEFFNIIQSANEQVNKDINNISNHLHSVNQNVEHVKSLIDSVKALSNIITIEVETISGMGEEEAANMEQIVSATSLLKEFVNEMNDVVTYFSI